MPARSVILLGGGLTFQLQGLIFEIIGEDFPRPAGLLARIVGGDLLGFPKFVVEVPYTDAPADRFCTVAEAGKFRDCRPLGGEYEHGR